MTQRNDDLAKYGVEISPAADPVDLGRGLIEVQVDIRCDIDPQLETVRLMRRTKRGTPVHAMRFSYNEALKVVSYSMTAEVGPSFHSAYNPMSARSGQIIATTFPDFCWLMTEGTTGKSIVEQTTPLREGTALGDLTWVLPSKFADDIIETMHVLNDTVLEGLMMDAIMYGPFYLAPAGA